MSRHLSLVLVLHNIRSTYNVGAILRTAEGLGVEKVVYSGYTPRYHDPDLLPHLREKLDRQIAKSALGAEEIVEQELLGFRGSLSGLCSGSSSGLCSGGSLAGLCPRGSSGLCLTKWLERAIMEGYTIVGLENNLSESEKSRQIVLGSAKNGDSDELAANVSGDSATRPLADVDFGEKIVLILGEEVHGIPAEVREQCQYFLEIPMQGRKESFNVSVATGIAAWALLNRDCLR